MPIEPPTLISLTLEGEGRGEGESTHSFYVSYLPTFLTSYRLFFPPYHPVQRDRNSRSHGEMIVRTGTADGLQPIPAALDDLVSQPPPRAEQDQGRVVALIEDLAQLPVAHAGSAQPGACRHGSHRARFLAGNRLDNLLQTAC